MEDFAAAVQPQCPEDRVVMRDFKGAWERPLCGFQLMQGKVAMPPEFEGPSFPGF